MAIQSPSSSSSYSFSMSFSLEHNQAYFLKLSSLENTIYLFFLCEKELIHHIDGSNSPPKYLDNTPNPEKQLVTYMDHAKLLVLDASISEDDLIDHILHDLGSDYKPFTRNIEARFRGNGEDSGALPPPVTTVHGGARGASGGASGAVTDSDSGGGQRQRAKDRHPKCGAPRVFLH
ncbi:F12P19.7 isoform 1 [Gossypium australe]|uniref:F12P19.7 isoform 1 n=1 Tax=Gossypium australe TaxID=47621 RepID=A0A5B6UWN5_9ROSI|nr:F12P19.7 isoform 1 [Gossypium australe]